MQPKNKFRLRAAPTPEILAQRQRDAEALLKLDEWTEEPSRQPLRHAETQAYGSADTFVNAAGTGGPPDARTLPGYPLPLAPIQKPVLAPPDKPARPWHDADPAVVHPYNIQLPKPLQHKLDFVWKRQDCKSMKAFVVDALTREVDRILTELGETP
jgi:hypothetical protein